METKNIDTNTKYEADKQRTDIRQNKDNVDRDTITELVLGFPFDDKCPSSVFGPKRKQPKKKSIHTKSKKMQNGNAIKIWIRIRPSTLPNERTFIKNKKEKILEIMDTSLKKEGIANNVNSLWKFEFNGILENKSQEDCYNAVVNDIIVGAMAGQNGTIMCYGQTGSGKTHTMTGSVAIPENQGIIPRALAHIYRIIANSPERHTTIRMSHIEIYNDQLYDLLNEGEREKLVIQNDSTIGLFMRNLTCHVANNIEQAANILIKGEASRKLGSNKLNDRSSRSHCIFTVYVESQSRLQTDSKYLTSKLHFVDLAGSERAEKSSESGKAEAQVINRSLAYFEQLIIHLENRTQSSFRNCKLTHLLGDSIGGNCNTVLITNVRSENSNNQETLSTLRLALRMKNIKMTPVVNEFVTDLTRLNKMELRVVALKKELAMKDVLSNNGNISYDILSEQQLYEIDHQVSLYLDGNISQLDVVNYHHVLATFESFKEIYRNQKSSIEARLKEKQEQYDHAQQSQLQQQQLSQPTATTGGAAGGETGDDQQVGDINDNGGFGIGPAAAGTKAATSSVVNLKKREKNKSNKKDRSSPNLKSGGSPSTTNRGVDSAAVNPASSSDNRDEADSPSSVIKTRPSTPPPRSEAFEDFKKTAGNEIKKIYDSNKENLQTKMRAYSKIAKQMNSSKAEMFDCKHILNDKSFSREQYIQETSEYSQPIISEEEYNLHKRIKDSSNTYKVDLVEVQSLKVEIKYIQKKVDQSKHRMVKEFENWYNETFLCAPFDGQSEPTVIELGYGSRRGIANLNLNEINIDEDEGEMFDRLQRELLANNEDMLAFTKAKMKMDKKEKYMHALGASYNNMTGVPKRLLRNKPPTTLHIEY